MACKNGQNPDQKSGKTDVLNPFTQSRRIQNQTMALFHTLFWVGAHGGDNMTCQSMSKIQILNSFGKLTSYCIELTIFPSYMLLSQGLSEI